MLKREELLKMFESAGAVRHGHFELSSGLHSGSYVQCAQVLQYPRFAEKLGQELAALFSDATIEVVVSPAMGGLIIGQEVARALPQPKAGLAGAGAPAIFVERDGSGTMCLRRGFSLKPDQHVLVIEDVWSWNVLLRPVVKLRRKSSEGSDLDDVNPIINTGLTAIITAERYLPVKSLPGVTLFLRARRP